MLLSLPCAELKLAASSWPLSGCIFPLALTSGNQRRNLFIRHITWLAPIYATSTLIAVAVHVQALTPTAAICASHLVGLELGAACFMHEDIRCSTSSLVFTAAAAEALCEMSAIKNCLLAPWEFLLNYSHTAGLVFQLGFSVAIGRV